jgi:hypothetical protein
VLQQTLVLVEQIGGLGLASPQFDSVQEMIDQGRPLILGMGGAIPAGGVLAFELSGLPFHPRWPRFLALSLAGVIVALGLWAAVFPGRRRSAG